MSVFHFFLTFALSIAWSCGSTDGFFILRRAKSDPNGLRIGKEKWSIFCLDRGDVNSRAGTVEEVQEVNGRVFMANHGWKTSWHGKFCRSGMGMSWYHFLCMIETQYIMLIQNVIPWFWRSLHCGLINLSFILVLFCSFPALYPFRLFSKGWERSELCLVCQSRG